MRLLLVASLFFLTACGYEIDPRTLWHARSGSKNMKAGEVSEAQKDYLEALGVDPFVSELHINLGLTYQSLKQPDSALQSYESAERWARNPVASFAARFNQGVLRGEAKKVEEALQAYQRALDIKPDSMEAKTNIELLIQQKQSQSGEGENKEQNQGGGQGQQGQKNQDQKDKDKKDKDKKDQDKDQNKDQKKEYENSPQYKPREFKGDLSEQDVKKILGELKQQEQKIRGQFHRGEIKEKPNEKDW